MRQPQTYVDWINELNNAVKEEEVLHCAASAGRLAPDKKMARHDIALIIVKKYTQEANKASDNVILTRDIKAKFSSICAKLFNSELDAVVSYIKKSEPNFNKTAEVSLGFVKPATQRVVDGKVIKGLGFLS